MEIFSTPQGKVTNKVITNYTNATKTKYTFTDGGTCKKENSTSISDKLTA